MWYFFFFFLLQYTVLLLYNSFVIELRFRFATARIFDKMDRGMNKFYQAEQRYEISNKRAK